MSGSDVFLSASLDSMRAACVNEIRTNTTFWKPKPIPPLPTTTERNMKSNMKPSPTTTSTTTAKKFDIPDIEVISFLDIAEHVINNDCPNDCSESGTCQQGNLIKFQPCFYFKYIDVNTLYCCISSQVKTHFCSNLFNKTQSYSLQEKRKMNEYLIDIKVKHRHLTQTKNIKEVKRMFLRKKHWRSNYRSLCNTDNSLRVQNHYFRGKKLKSKNSIMIRLHTFVVFFFTVGCF